MITLPIPRGIASNLTQFLRAFIMDVNRELSSKVGRDEQPIIRSPNGTAFAVQVDDNGVISTAVVKEK